MSAVAVVTAAEQGGVLVQQHGLNGSQIGWQAVNGLAGAVVADMHHRVGGFWCQTGCAAVPNVARVQMWDEDADCGRI